MAADIKSYMSIGRFMGENSEDAEKYFRKVERFQAKALYSDVNKASMIPFGLEGKALDYYETLSEEIKADYNQIKEAIITHFKPNKSKLVRWHELN